MKQGVIGRRRIFQPEDMRDIRSTEALSDRFHAEGGLTRLGKMSIKFTAQKFSYSANSL